MPYNLTKLLDKLIKNFIEKQNINSILVAVSGGQDSILLISILNNIRNNFNHKIKISYIYIDHQWKYSSKLQIKHLTNYIKSKNSNITIYQINQATKSENNCREKRYHIIYNHAIKYKYNLVITGHNSSDKVETFFQNISRKSGIEGLSSPTIHSNISYNFFLLRPLLNINKEEIHRLCKKLNLPIWSDNTNYIYKIHRNRIRYELLPYIRNFFNTKIENNLIYSIKNHYYENEYIKQNATKLYLQCKHNFKIAINYRKLSKQHLILQIKSLQIFYINNLKINLHHETIKKIINMTSKQLNKRIIIFEDNNYIHLLNQKWLYVNTKSK
uniref:tRNA(Ile)-lysidine synthase, chloroplastic n=1 Tax=Leptosiphonia brodiei TaxID=2608611 RepID=A0A1Z1MAC8_9FLOR|nr:tRNA Ile-lysidine synthetase [Leptosiphonia brodiei]ARW62842.1 tRNA Ile-lysidine synthetase [Leptosiphonia brodiei]